MRLLFIGGGNMGAAIAAGALRKLPAAELIVVDPNVDRARSLLPAKGARFHETLDAVSCECFDATILAIKPQKFHALPDNALPTNRGVVVSIMAGVTLSGMEAKLGSSRIIRTMPNLPALVSRGMTVGVTAETVGDADKALVAEIFQGSGCFEWLEDEAQIDSVTAVAGSGPGYIFAFAHYMTEAAKVEGLPAELADTLVRQTLLGAAELLHSDPRTALALKEAVTSKRGTTEAGLAVFEGVHGFPELCLKGVHAARQRATELARDD